jgi:hypothetical protein
MKLKLVLLTFCAAAGIFASIAVAKQPPGHGNPHSTTTGTTTGTTSTSVTGTTTTTSDHGKKGKGKGPAAKVLVCHKVGNGHYVLIKVSANSAPAKGKHGGDVLAGTNGTCPGPIQGHGRTTTTATTTTAATTTS